MPRMICGLLVGLAFGIAGNTFQTMIRNPLASPDIIGISSGSSIAAVFCILVLHMSGSSLSVAAVISGIIASTLVYVLSKGSGFSDSRLILIGIGIQAMINALRWLSGSLNGMSMEAVPTLFIVVVIFGVIIICLTKQLQILELGDEFTTTLGVKINLIRIILILSSVFLIAFATAITGPIAFVAFLSGPIASRLVELGAPYMLFLLIFINRRGQA